MKRHYIKNFSDFTRINESGIFKGKDDMDCKCSDDISRIECCNEITLDHEDEKTLHSVLTSHPESHTFMDSLSHNVHAHLDFYNNHITLEFPHLGKKHNIEFDLEGSYPSSHGDHGISNYNLTPHIVLGGGFKIPVLSFNKRKRSRL